MKQRTTQGNVVRYYTRPGSRIGYNLVMKGSKHFGYYDKTHTTEPTAQTRFLEKISELLQLEPGMNIFDAGCGQGVVACYVAGNYDVQITGLTLVPFEVKSAEKRAQREHVASKTSFMVGDYADPPFAPKSFDRIYAVETLSHAPDVALVISQFMKLIKPGGRLVCIEYEADLEKIDAQEPTIIDFAMHYGALHGLRQFTPGQFLATLKKAGFKEVTEYDRARFILIQGLLSRKGWQTPLNS